MEGYHMYYARFNCSDQTSISHQELALPNTKSLTIY